MTVDPPAASGPAVGAPPTEPTPPKLRGGLLRHHDFRQLFLGDTLDSERISAHYDAGVLTLRIPVAPQAKPRKISVNSTDDHESLKAGQDHKVINA